MLERHAEARFAEHEPELLLPERGKSGSQRRVGQHHGQHRGKQQKDARGRPPAREIERGRAHAMTEPAEHRVGQRAFIPRAVVTATVDEEGGRDHDPARPRAALVGGNPRFGVPGGLFGVPGVVPRQVQIVGDRAQVVLGQGLRAGHQLDVRLPEPLRIIGALDELGGAPRDVAAGQRPMPEHVAQALAEIVADLADLFVGRPAVRTRVAAVLDERDLGVGGTEDVIVGDVHGPIEPITQPCLRHSTSRPESGLKGFPSRQTGIEEIGRTAAAPPICRRCGFAASGSRPEPGA